MRGQISQLSQRVEQKASFANFKNLEAQLNDYAKSTSVQYVMEELRTKCDSITVQRLKDEYLVHVEKVNDLMTN